MLRTHQGGCLNLSPSGGLPFDPANLPPTEGIELAGVAGWWLGLAMFHTLFMREHNAICGHLATEYPHWTDQELYDHARLIVAALIAKIHTLEWTPALLAEPTLEFGMRVNWWGIQGEWLSRRFGRLTKNEELSGIPGSDLYYHGASFALTEEFAAVYRLHALMPDDYLLRSSQDDHRIAQLNFSEISGTRTHEVLDDEHITMSDLFYSFGRSYPGALVLHNYPTHLRKFAQPDGSIFDMAAVDILRDRERGVPRYNDFRRAFRLASARRFEDFSDNPAIVAELRELYASPDEVDLMVGLYAERRPKGFAISETAFRVFILMASRRLKSDRFFTYDFTPEVYTPEGMRWIQDNTLVSILQRHFPDLRPGLRGVANAFKPWNTAPSPGPGLAWRLRRGLWDVLVRFKFGSAQPLEVPVPKDAPPVVAVPFARKYPDTPITGIAADQAPIDELDRRVLCFIRFEELLARIFPPAQPGLPLIDADATVALADAYRPSYRKLYRMPTRPREYDGDIDLGRLAVASPYACYLTRDQASDLVQWDLRRLSDYEVHPGLRSPGTVVEFSVDAKERRLHASRIDSELGSSSPGDRDWAAAQRLAMCSIATHTTLVRHFNWIHLVCGGPLAIVTHNCLPPNHPVRRFLQPHVYATHFGNRIVTPLQMTKGGDFESIFSFTHGGLCDLFDATREEFDLRVMEPDYDTARRGISDLEVDMPALENRRLIMSVIRAHASRYLAAYYDTDVSIAADADVDRWHAELATYVPSLRALTDATVTISGMTTLLSTLIYMVAVDHEIVDSGVWDYQLWSDVQTPRVYRDGGRMPLDTYQRLVNANFMLNVPRTRLMTDFSYLALDAHGAAAFVQFHDDLLRLQQDLDGEEAHPWRLEPRFLKANMNY
jgi:arachidonate 15-lipoxygenase